MQNKDKGDGIKDFPLDMLLVILLEEASMEVSWLVTPSSHITRISYLVGAKTPETSNIIPTKSNFCCTE